MKNRRLFCVLWVIALLCISLSCQETHVIRRAIFDIGSGTTRMTIADVNAKTGEVTLVHETAEPVSYKLDLESNKNEFSEEIRNKGTLVLAKMKWAALQQGAQEFAAVATSAFRTAQNGSEFAQFITKVLGIRLSIISQEQEGILGFLAAAQKENKEKIVVWDIGGGSMQLTTMDGNGKFHVYGGKLASVSFASYIIQTIQKKDISKVKTPNPIAPEEMEKAISHAKSSLGEIPSIVREKLKDPKTVVLGIGGVHYYSIRNQIGMGNTYTVVRLKETLDQRLGKTDAEIGGEYANTEVSNLGLVLAFMQEMGLESVKTKKVNNTNGMMLYPDLWK